MRLQHYTPEQERQLKAWLRRGTTQTRCSIAVLATRMGVNRTTLYGEIKRRRSRTCTRKARVADTTVKKTHVTLREGRAKASDHTKVTSRDVSEALQHATKTGVRLKGMSRVRSATSKGPALTLPGQCWRRAPTERPRNAQSRG